MENSTNKALKIYESNFLEERIYLDTHTVSNWINDLFSWLFCTLEVYKDRTFFENKEKELQSELEAFFIQLKYNETEVKEKLDLFFEKLPELHQSLLEDLNTVLEFDPSARSKNEVLIAYPGFFAITAHRIAHQLWESKVAVLPRLIAENAHSKTGIDIHPGAQIGKRFFIDHGTGIVIGETSKIGNDVKIYQGVTLGALSVSRDKVEEKRHPTIEDKVVIYANATILGGKTVVGRGAVIGGNVWITNSIPAQSLVYHKSEIIVKDKQSFPETLNFII